MRGKCLSLFPSFEGTHVYFFFNIYILRDAKKTHQHCFHKIDICNKMTNFLQSKQLFAQYFPLFLKLCSLPVLAAIVTLN